MAWSFHPTILVLSFAQVCGIFFSAILCVPYMKALKYPREIRL